MRDAFIIVILAVCLLLGVPSVVFLSDQVQSRQVTKKIERAGGFIGSVGPPPWIEPVYHLVWRIHSFWQYQPRFFPEPYRIRFLCVPYQLVLNGSSVSDQTLSLAKGLKYLGFLDLYDATITSRQVELLRGLSRLKEMSFHNCVVPEGTLAQLRRSLPNVQIISEKK